MGSVHAEDYFFKGAKGYAHAAPVEHEAKQGALVYFANPDPRKLHAVDVDGMNELYHAIEAVEAHADDLAFCVFYGAYDPVHAGADITQFAGDPDVDAIRAHLYRGTDLDTRVKALWPKLRTVAAFCGDRYGGSVEWPLFAEWGVCDKATRIQFTEVHLGIVPGWNGILNTWLKGGRGNARYMGCTGNPVNAEQMKLMGLVQEVVETPDAPDRRAIERDQWAEAWAAHAEVCEELLLSAALDVATQEKPLIRSQGYELAFEDKQEEEINRRLDPAPYAALKKKTAEAAAALDPETQKDELKALIKASQKELAAMGKPLAPQAVAAVQDYLTRWGSLTTGEVFERYGEIGRNEADLCAQLMETEHRRIGIDAVLNRDPAAKIPVFA